MSHTETKRNFASHSDLSVDITAPERHLKPRSEIRLISRNTTTAVNHEFVPKSNWDNYLSEDIIFENCHINHVNSGYANSKPNVEAIFTTKHRDFEKCTAHTASEQRFMKNDLVVRRCLTRFRPTFKTEASFAIHSDLSVDGKNLKHQLR